MLRATLAELDGLSVKDKRCPHPIEITRWHDRGWFRFDGDTFRLTATGKERAATCCATCKAWKPIANTTGGECWSGGRLDDDRAGPADITAAYDFCEVHSEFLRPRS